MTAMGMRSDNRLDSIGLKLPELYEVRPREISTGRAVIDNSRDSSACICETSEPTKRRFSSVTFLIDHDTSSSIIPLTDEDGSGKGDIPWHIGHDLRRMSAPELPPIRNNSGNNSSLSGHQASKSLLKNHSSGSLGEKRGVNTHSPHSLRSSSSDFSNKIFPSTGTGSVSWYLSNEQIPASTTSAKLETLFEKKSAMTRDTGTPRTLSSQGGHSSHKLGRMPSLTKMNITNNNNSTYSRMSTRESRATVKKKRPVAINSSSEAQLLSKAPSRLQSRLGRSSTSSGQIYNNNEINNGILNLTRNSSEQRITNNSRYVHNNNDKNRKRSPGSRVPDGFYPKNLQSGTVNGMRKYSSTFALDTLNRRRSREDGDTEAEGTDEYEENDKRIIDWLIGADEAEPPPESDIVYVDEPPQTDTALHIVYDEN